MKSVYILFIIMYCNISSSSQITFERLYELYSDDSQGYSVVQNFDNGYVIAGTSGKITSQKKIIVFRTNEYGDTIWIRRIACDWGGAEGYSILITQDNSIIVCGRYNYNIPLIKIDQSGTIISITEIGVNPGIVEIGYSVKQTLDSGYIITGQSYPYSGRSDAYLARTDNSGDTLWTRKFGEFWLEEIGYDVIQTSDSGFLVAGYSMNDSTWLNKVLLVKTDQNGSLQWMKRLGNDDSDNRATSIAETSDQGLIIAGNTGNYSVCEILLLRLNKNGDTVWRKSILPANSGYAYAESIKITADQGFIITGTNGFGVFLLRTDSSGNVVWSRDFSELWTWGFEVSLTTDSGYIVTGYSDDPGYYLKRVYLVKTDEDGLITNTQEHQPDIPFIAFPDPAITRITIKMPEGLVGMKGSEEEMGLEVFDIYGRLIYSRAIPDENPVEIDVSAWSEGIYMARLIGRNDVPGNVKFMVKRK